MTVSPNEPGASRSDACDPNLINALRRARFAGERETPTLTPEARVFLQTRMGGADFVDRLLGLDPAIPTNVDDTDDTATPAQTTTETP